MVRLMPSRAASSFVPDVFEYSHEPKPPASAAEQDDHGERERAGASSMTRDGATVFEHDVRQAS